MKFKTKNQKSGKQSTNPSWWDKEITIGNEKTRAKILIDKVHRTEVEDFKDFRAIIEGHCKICGSNRLEYGFKEPEGVFYISCAVCERSDFDGNNPHWYEIGESK
jgi:hypothetical protein